MTIRVDELDKVDFREVLEPGGELIAPTSPGDILRHEFLEPLGMSANALARALHVPANRITAVLKSRRRITADTALRLARYLGTTPQFWLGLQDRYDLETTRSDRGEMIRREITPREVSHAG